MSNGRRPQNIHRDIQELEDKLKDLSLLVAQVTVEIAEVRAKANRTNAPIATANRPLTVGDRVAFKIGCNRHEGTIAETTEKRVWIKPDDQEAWVIRSPRTVTPL